jgi:sulfite reductase beta subunit-like hemoprotein
VIPSLSELHAQVFAFAKGVSEHLLPRTTAYHEIWLDKKLVAGEALKDFEPLYGEFYLPRKVCLTMIFLDKNLPDHRFSVQSCRCSPTN